MTKKQEKIWAYKVKNPKATISEIAKATKSSNSYVHKLMAKIGTPKEVLEIETTGVGPDWYATLKDNVPRETSGRDKILSTASDLISGERHEEYGDAKDNFDRISGYWNAHLGLNNFITSSDVAAMMVLLKISRLHGDGPKDVDTYVDICGYAAIGGEIASLD
jgi:hypothetical protein